MDYLAVSAVPFVGLVILVGAWLGWQLLRQNGRILLRLDELEQRLNELEFGGVDEPQGLMVGSEAPAIELPDLKGQRKSLAQFRGQSVLLVFFNPACGYCREMVPKLAALPARSSRREEAHTSNSQPSTFNSQPSTFNSQPSTFNSQPKEQDQSLVTSAATNGDFSGWRPLVLILTTGDAEKNQQFFAEHKVAFPVLLQNDGEIAKAYQVNGTPAGYLVSAGGRIASKLAIGAEALLELTSQPAKEPPLTPTLSPTDGESEKTGIGGDGRANRFSRRSVARSKIKRDGLKAGTPAPDFRLPRLDGSGDLTLSELRGRRVLLVFSSPHCGPCNTLAPELEKFYRKHNGTLPASLSMDRALAPSPRPSPPVGERVADSSGEGEHPETTVVMNQQGRTEREPLEGQGTRSDLPRGLAAAMGNLPPLHHVRHPHRLPG